MNEQNEEDLKEKKAKTDTSENFKIKVGTVGNFVLVAFIVLILGTAGLIYFLIHTEKENYD